MSKRFIGFLLGMFLLTAVVFFYVLYQGSALKPLQQSPGQGGTAEQPAAPKVPGVSLTVYASKEGNTLVVQWHDLPDGTVVLDIYRRPVNSTSNADWKLWKQITLSPGDLASGMAQFKIGNALLNNYSFTVEAVSDTSQGIIWSSTSTTPSVTTSTLPEPPAENSPPQNNQPPQSPAPPASTTVPTPPAPTSTSNNSTSSTGTSSTPPAVPKGTPYYSPNIQISGYGQAQAGNFWVQHVDQKIQIGWQDLPPQTTNIAVVRSSDQNGPWSTILTQQNPVIEGSYSIQVVDNTVGQPYYYELNIFSGNDVIGTYGPAYLAAVEQ